MIIFFLLNVFYPFLTVNTVQVIGKSYQGIAWGSTAKKNLRIFPCFTDTYLLIDFLPYQLAFPLFCLFCLFMLFYPKEISSLFFVFVGPIGNVFTNEDTSLSCSPSRTSCFFLPQNSETSAEWILQGNHCLFLQSSVPRLLWRNHSPGQLNQTKGPTQMPLAFLLGSFPMSPLIHNNSVF